MKNPIEYYVKLDAPPSIEQIKLLTQNGHPIRTATGKRGAALFQYGKPVAHFFLTSTQIAKLRRGQGRLAITHSAIDHFRHLYGSPDSPLYGQ